MFRVVTAAAFAVLAGGFAAPAFAQQAGTYNGTDANGDPFSVTLGTNPNDGKLAVLAEGIGLPAHGTCKPATTTPLVGYGTGFQTDLKGNKVTTTFDFPQEYTVAKLTFNGNTVTGTVLTYEVVFGSYTTGRPKKASFCTVPTQTVSGTLGAPMAPALAQQAHMTLN